MWRVQHHYRRLGGLPWPRGVESFRDCGALLCSLLTLHVHRDAPVDVSFSPDAIDGLLRFAVTAVAALHGVGR